MTLAGDNGSQSVPDPEEFHSMMQRLYQEQRQECVLHDSNGNFTSPGPPLKNSCIVQARLPSVLYSKFYQFLKAQGWSKTTGVKYAIYKLLKEQNHE